MLARIDDWLDRPRPGRRRDLPLACLLLAPAFLVLGLFGILPFFAALYMSLFAGKPGAMHFAGLGNYAEALQSDVFWNSVRVTLYYVLGTVPATLFISFWIAFGLSRIVRGRGVLRTLYFLPYITSAVAAAMVWRALLDPRTGAVNLALGWIGLPAQAWLLEPRGALHLVTGGAIAPEIGPSLALCCIIAFDIWHSSGFMIVVFLAGLTAIPRELEDAARMDGAGIARLVWSVTLPLLAPIVFLLAVVGTLRAFQSFNSFFALAGAGAQTLGTTENLVLHIYTQFYEHHYWGYGAAAAVLLSLALMALTIVQWRVLGKRVYTP